MVPAGYYTAVAVPIDTQQGRVWAQFGKAKTGTDQVVVMFSIIEGEMAGERLPWIGYFSEKSEDRTLESLRLVGWVGDEIEAVVHGPLDQKVSITVEHNKNPENGKVMARVAWVNAFGSGGGLRLDAPLVGNDLKAFSARMKAKAKSVPPVKGEKAEAPPPAPPRAPAEQPGAAALGDVPF